MYTITISKGLPEMVTAIKNLLDENSISHTFSQTVEYSSASGRSNTDCCFKIDEQNNENIRDRLNAMFDDMLEKALVDVKRDITTQVYLSEKGMPSEEIGISQ